jgi:D-glycero-alpha-D-manno-heptose 1-phosphate guanylyltransferase
MITEAIILAGGLGTRLREAVPDLPKCMAPVAGKPFISFVIDYYLAQGITRFIFSLGYEHEVIEDYLSEHYPSVNYDCYIEDTPLGTGGAIKKGCTLAESSQVLILNGDTLFAVDLAAVAAFHEETDAECTLSLKEMVDSDRYGVVSCDDRGRITAFKEKKWYSRSVINGGVYALNSRIFVNADLPERFSFEKDYLEKYFAEKKFFGKRQDGYFIDIGIPEDFQRAQTELKQ